MRKNIYFISLYFFMIFDQGSKFDQAFSFLKNYLLVAVSIHHHVPCNKITASERW